MKKYVVALALAALAGTASAETPRPLIQGPYEPSAATYAEVQGVNTWMELYSVLPKEVPSALNMLVTQGTTPPAAGVVLSTALHVTMNDKEVQLAETSFISKRNNRPVAYDRECRVLPQPGDTVRLTFGGPQGRASLNLKVVEFFVFEQKEVFGQPAELVRYEVAAPEDCARMYESRLVLSGELQVSAGKKRNEKIPVMAQAIFINQ